jgi:CRISPR/Cas system-associated exonuclease Cas4 (RecB family)
MTVTADTRLQGRTRWSMAVRCPRQAGYALLGEEPAPENDDTLLLFERGKMDEDWFVTHVLEPKFGVDNIIRQKAVPWPATGLPVGELHGDAFVTSEGMPWEVKSRANGEPADFDFVQLAGAIHFDPDATKDAGVLAVIDRDLKREYIPVVLNDELRDQVEDIAAQVVSCARTGELPTRVCQKPADGRARMCPFVHACFADWTPPDPINLDGDVAVVALDVMHKQNAKREATQTLELADQEYKEAAARLAEHDLAAGVDYIGSGVKVKRTAFPDSERFSLSKARKAGVWTPSDDERFGPFLGFSGGHNRWAIEQSTVSAAAAAEDFGDEAPWTSEDLDG